MSQPLPITAWLPMTLFSLSSVDEGPSSGAKVGRSFTTNGNQWRRTGSKNFPPVQLRTERKLLHSKELPATVRGKLFLLPPCPQKAGCSVWASAAGRPGPDTFAS